MNKRRQAVKEEAGARVTANSRLPAMFSFQPKNLQSMQTEKNPAGDRNFQFSVRVISVRFNEAVKVAVMNTFRELKETTLEGLKEGTEVAFHQIEYQ